ncbi:hypothetical protein M0802_004328 [Mischocyttarus mexicanus]|nr:hypothetical protein M0802_004328 [Mischocyttarus mexicanus]
MVLIVASCGRRGRLVEEVPGLYIRRLTLEDPRSLKERSSGSRSRTPPRHICHPAGPYVSSSSTTSSSFFSTRGSSSYRSWQERLRKERPAYLTIVSLELPESPIPLIESQAGERNKSNYLDVNPKDDKDDILDELLEKVCEIGKERDKESRGRKLDTFSNNERRGVGGGGGGGRRKRRSSRKNQVDSLECTKEVATLEECTRNILRTSQEGDDELLLTRTKFQNVDDCICSEIPENLRINVRKKTEVTCATSRSPSPEITHTIRIAMKYHGRSGLCKIANTEVEKDVDRKNKKLAGKNLKDISDKTKTTDEIENRDYVIREEGCCTGVNVALDFTLNCNSVRLTSRDISLKAETNDERSY